jgi:Carboxylesterase type B
LDVIVNIHSGAFMFGSGSESGPKYLLDQDVILVTFNYRLGPFGKII